jgi:hypothetical protein
MVNSTGVQAHPVRADEIADLLDKLVGLRLGLRPICGDGKHDLSPEARQRVTDGCETLHTVIAELVEMLRDDGTHATEPSLRTQPR